MPAGHTTTNLHAIWASGIADIHAVGDAGTILHSTGNGTWTLVASGTTQNVMSVWGFGNTDVYASTDGGSIVHGK